MEKEQTDVPDVLSKSKKIACIIGVLFLLLFSAFFIVSAVTQNRQEQTGVEGQTAEQADIQEEQSGLQEETCKNSVTSITTTVTEDSLALLDQHSNLTGADLSGSTCYKAIWNSLHPAVKVRFTVSVDGVQIENTETVLDWQGHSVPALTEAAENLPQFTEIRLGITNATAAELDALREAFPDTHLRYAVLFSGKIYFYEETSIDLSWITSEQIMEAAELLQKLPLLSKVCLMPADGSESTLSFEDYEALYTARPDVAFDYSFELFGKNVSVQTTALKYKKTEIGDEGLEEFRNILPWLPNLTYLSLDRCDTTDEAMAQLRDDFPTVKIVWRAYFGNGFSCMTDVEKIWAIGGISDDDSTALKYCTDVRYLDVGHNALTDVSFLNYMPKLEVAILAFNNLVDISPLANCTELEYLELTDDGVEDISVLANLKNLKHLELSQCYHINDLSPIYSLDLERFYMINSYNENLTEQFETFKVLHPNCEVNFTNTALTSPYYIGNWRYTAGVLSPRYALLREQLGYDDPFGTTRLYWYLDRDDNQY